MRDLFEEAEAVKQKLLVGCIASCTCGTKSHVHHVHSDDCQYRVRMEAIDVIEQLVDKVKDLDLFRE